MSVYACCCKRDCRIVEDGFNRADSTEVGPGWEKVSGDWRIVGNELQEVSGNGVVITTKRHPVDNPTGLLWVDLVGLAHGKKYRILVNYNEDDESYYYGEYCHDDDPELCYVAVGDQRGELDRWYIESTMDDDRLHVCRTMSAISAHLEHGAGTRYARACEIPDNRGRRAGLANATGGRGSAAIRLDDFDWQEHRITNEQCAQCRCDCDGHCMPRKLLMTFVVSECDCDTLDGIQAVADAWATEEDFEVWSFVPLLLKYGPFHIFTTDIDPPDPGSDRHCTYEIHITAVPDE